MRQKPKPLVLIVDDDREYAERVAADLNASYRTSVALTGDEGVHKTRVEHPAVVLLDRVLPGALDWRDVLERIREACPNVIVLLVSAFLEPAVMAEALDLGAEGCVTKDMTPGTLKRHIHREIEKNLIFRRFEALKEQQQLTSVTPVFESPAMKAIEVRLDEVKHTRDTILLTGPTGSGKAVIARWIHDTSIFNDKPFGLVTLPATNPQFMLSLLFGHVKGAYTDAREDRKGWFETLDGGTIVLDEIAELPEESQARLLEVIEDKTFARIGETKKMTVDVRIIACTNRDLDKAVAAGRFRADLYARIQRHHVRLPALDDRREDIPTLVEQMRVQYNREYRRQVDVIDPEVIAELQERRWPNNLRSLQDLISTAILRANGKRLTLADIFAVDRRPGTRAAAGSDGSNGWIHLPYVDAKRRFARSYFEHKLRLSQGVVARAARLADMSREHFSRKIKDLGLNPSDFKPDRPGDSE
ncbi:MAG: sigma-54 dependent transcriptional regulator [bacterium]